MKFGHLLFGGLGGKDVNELVLSICHLLLLKDVVLTRALSPRLNAGIEPAP
jgi:hypothetical protein